MHQAGCATLLFTFIDFESLDFFDSELQSLSIGIRHVRKDKVNANSVKGLTGARCAGKQP